MKRALMILTLLAGPVAADPIFKGSDWVIETDTSLTVYSDRGGDISDYQDFIDQIDGKSVKVLGTCVSSCTMFLGMSDVCVAPGATIGFHGPSSSNQSIVHLKRLVSSIASYYPDALKGPFENDWGLDRDVKWFLGAEVALMADIPLCTVL